jgi:hypothetical protein
MIQRLARLLVVLLAIAFARTTRRAPAAPVTA